jgi:hypothetical protein
MTLDQLDHAFQAGVIDEATSVWTHGMHAWTTLGTLTRMEVESALPATEDVEVEFDEEEVTTWRGGESRAGFMQRQAAKELALPTSRDSLSTRPHAGARAAAPARRPRGADDTMCKAPPARRSRRSAEPQAHAQTAISELYSTAPLAISLTEPVIPFRREAPRRDLKLWGAAAAAALGLLSYGVSVFPIATTSAGASDARQPAEAALTSPASSPAPAVTQQKAGRLSQMPINAGASQQTKIDSSVPDVPALRADSPPSLGRLESKKAAIAQSSKSFRRKAVSSKRKSVRKATASSGSKNKSGKSKLAPRAPRTRRASSDGKSG